MVRCGAKIVFVNYIELSEGRLLASLDIEDVVYRTGHIGSACNGIVLTANEPRLLIERRVAVTAASLVLGGLTKRPSIDRTHRREESVGCGESDAVHTAAEGEAMNTAVDQLYGLCVVDYGSCRVDLGARRNDDLCFASFGITTVYFAASVRRILLLSIRFTSFLKFRSYFTYI